MQETGWMARRELTSWDDQKRDTLSVTTRYSRWETKLNPRIHSALILGLTSFSRNCKGKETSFAKYPCESFRYVRRSCFVQCKHYVKYTSLYWKSSFVIDWSLELPSLQSWQSWWHVGAESWTWRPSHIQKVCRQYISLTMNHQWPLSPFDCQWVPLICDLKVIPSSYKYWLLLYNAITTCCAASVQMEVCQSLHNHIACQGASLGKYKPFPSQIPLLFVVIADVVIHWWGFIEWWGL